MAARPSPKEMFDRVKSRHPDWANSRIRREVERYNTRPGRGHYRGHPDPTGDEASRNADEFRAMAQDQQEKYADMRRQGHGHELAMARIREEIESKEEAVMDLMTKEEAAAFMHVPLNTLSHWLATGQAPTSAKIGKRRMFRRSDLEAFIERKFQQQAS